MALLSLQQIHKTFEKGTVNENHVLRVWISTLSRETLSLLLEEMVLVNQP